MEVVSNNFIEVVPMSSIIDVQSTLTDRYQTTIPEPVRLALKLNRRDKIYYKVKASGEVVLSRAPSAEDEDPVIGKFLGLLESDMNHQPSRIESLQPELITQLDSLVGQVEVDLDAPLSSNNE